MRSKKGLWPQIESTFKQMDVAATEFECFQALQKQEQLAASHRINNLWAEVQKQKELERTLQKRYGDLMAELERITNVMEQCRVQAQLQEEMEAKNRELESIKATADEISVQGTEEVQAQQEEEIEGKNHTLESTKATADGATDQKIDIVQDQDPSNSKNDMDVDSLEEQTAHNTDVKLPDAHVAEDESAKVADDENIDTTLGTSAAVEINSIEGNGEDPNVGNPDEVVEAANQPDNNSIKETTPLDDMEAVDGKVEEVN